MPEIDDQTVSPGFLIAAPNLLDPNFARTVVLMAEHHDEGAMGFIVNREAPVVLGEVLEAVDDGLAVQARARGIDAEPVLIGGPVQPDTLWILHPRDDGDDDVVPLGDRFALGASRDLLDALVTGVRPGPFRLLLGYAGWGPRQMEHETAAGAWLFLDLAEDLLFDVPLADRWDEAVRRLGLDPGGFMMGGPGAEA